MQTFEITKSRHHFGDARDAIDATSAFEASTLEEWSYEIRPRQEGWIVEVSRIGPAPRLIAKFEGHLRPVEA